MTLATLSEKTGLSVGLVVTLAVMLAAGVGTFAKTQADVSRLDEKVTELQAARVEQAKSDVQTQLRLQRGEDNYAAILRTLGKMEAQLDRLTTGGAFRQVRATP
jgi:hypothetical protein